MSYYGGSFKSFQIEAEVVTTYGLSSSEELELRWNDARKRLVNTLPDDIHTAWTVHPVFGPLSSLQAGGLIGAHLEHHLRHWPKPSKKAAR